MATSKKCRRCHQTLPLEKFVDNNGDLNPRGHYCQSCHLKRVEQRHRAALKKEKSYIKKFKIVYGAYWRHYASPEYFHTMLKDERDFCPYCGIKFCDVIPDPFNESPMHMDHMDPLDKGGEHSIRNVVFCCGPCNIKKGKRSFQQWLEVLEPQYRDLARAIYGEKHGHPPEDFIEGCSTQRGMYDLEMTLFQTEEELKRQFPKPKVDGPPSG
jgi:hypothetical protein